MTIALCIPAFDAAAFLPRLLGSAAAQTIRFDEIIVYDDCSADDTALIAEEYGAKVLRGERNCGCATGKNRLARAATSDWLHFHDADDDLLPNFVEVARKWTLRESPPDVILFNYEYRDHATGSVHAVPKFDEALLRRDPIEFVLRHKIVNFGLYRREPFLKVGGFDIDREVLYNEDAAFHNRLALAGMRFGFEPDVTCVNFRHAQSMSASNRGRTALAQIRVLQKTMRLLHAKHIHKYDRLLAARFLGMATVNAVEDGWRHVDEAILEARALGYRMPSEGSLLFRLAAVLAPRSAFRLREWTIRRLYHSRRSRAIAGEATP